MSEPDNEVTFALDKTGGVEWYLTGSVELTEQQAMVIGVNRLAGATADIAMALREIAEAIRERSE